MIEGILLKNSDVPIPSMRMIFLRPCWPLTIIICDELTLSILAKNLIHILFAAPSTGGDVRRIFRYLSCRPQILLLEALG